MFFSLYLPLNTIHAPKMPCILRTIFHHRSPYPVTYPHTSFITVGNDIVRNRLSVSHFVPVFKGNRVNFSSLRHIRVNFKVSFMTCFYFWNGYTRQSLERPSQVIVLKPNRQNTLSTQLSFIKTHFKSCLKFLKTANIFKILHVLHTLKYLKL